MMRTDSAQPEDETSHEITHTEKEFVSTKAFITKRFQLFFSTKITFLYPINYLDTDALRRRNFFNKVQELHAA